MYEKLRDELAEMDKENRALRSELECVGNKVAELKTELAECRKRVTRYAEEAMEARDQQDPEIIIGHTDESLSLTFDGDEARGE